MVLRKRGDIIAKKATTIAIVNQKGGTAKTTTCENLGIGLAMEGKKVLLVDVDPQGSLTISIGWQPYSYIKSCRIMMAKEYLARGSSYDEAAEKVGYKNGKTLWNLMHKK